MAAFFATVFEDWHGRKNFYLRLINANSLLENQLGIPPTALSGIVHIQQN
jgi:hypothetical protein